MRNIATMARREFGAYFLSPIAYVVMAVFLFTVGLAFALGTFRAGGEASLRGTVEFWMVLVLVFVIPMLTMRLMSEEIRSGTVESLLTVPVTEAEVVLGKFLGSLAFYGVLLLSTLLYPSLLAIYGDLDPLLAICHYFGLVMLGSLFAAVGLFFSTLTRHQVVAVLGASALLALMTFASQRLSLLVEGYPKVMLQQISVAAHYGDFTRGLVDLNHVVFFVTTTALFLFLAVKVLELRRWQ